MSMLSTNHLQHAAMRLMLAASLMPLLLGRPDAAFAQTPPRINCTAPHQLDLNLTPVGRGPLALAEVYCQTMPPLYFPRTTLAVSPDGRSLAYYRDASVLRVARLDTDKAWTEFQAELGVFERFSSNFRSV